MNPESFKNLGHDSRRYLNYLIVLVLAMVTIKTYLYGLAGGFAFFRSNGAVASQRSWQEECEHLRNFPLKETTIHLAESIEAGQTAFISGRDSSCGGDGQAPGISQGYCRVAGFTHTSLSKVSGVHFEVWIPQRQNWKQRVLATGNGGLNGCIGYSALAYGTKNGFVTVGSNNGHNGTSGRPFFNSPEVVADFAGRSIMTITVKAQAIAAAFYGPQSQTNLKTYFLGCSQGGRQAVSAAEMYPDLFDGIVAGAPAIDFNMLVSWRASFYPITGKAGSTDFVGPELWTGLIHQEVLRQCDGLDGATDGIVEHPDRCVFDPETLGCRDEQTADCLSKTQIERVRKVFAPLRHDGRVLYPGMAPGGEILASKGLYAGKPFQYSVDWFRYVVYSNPEWDPASFTSNDALQAEILNPNNIKAFPPELNRFKSRGGKMLVFHGLQDQQISSLNTDRWFNLLLQSSTQTQLDKWIRYFRISGLNHCSGGPGAWNIGQGDSIFDPSSNILAALVDWVENGKSLDKIEGSQTGVNLVALKRKHCKFPLHNTYQGLPLPPISQPNIVVSTSPDDWQCV